MVSETTLENSFLLIVVDNCSRAYVGRAYIARALVSGNFFALRFIKKKFPR